ncbi:MAG: DUF938 domain-containing protein [Oceanicaulis sp.]
MAETDRTPIALETRTAEAARLASPSAGRNKGVIAETLAGVLPRGAMVLEIASGTGEHALACVTARDDIRWTPSDPDPASRASADAWAANAGGRIGRCLDLDVTRPNWDDGLEPVDAVFCANMIHIAPWEAAEGLFAGAARVLKPGGALHLYGPFQEGANTAPSNLDFDASLKARDPRWGVRARSDVDALALRCGLTPADRTEMPANNLLLSFTKAGA